MDYIFQTGHGKGLARVELTSVFGDVIRDEVDDGLVLHLDEITDARALLSRLGGVVRITQVLQAGPASMPLNFEEWVNKALLEKKDMCPKLKYGLSMHPKNDGTLKKILHSSKKNLAKEFSHLRFVNKNFQNLSSVQAWHEGLLENNAIELQLFKSETKWYLCKTLAIQNFEWYSHRDYDRPARSAKNGMFPPKVAQELINLAVGDLKPNSKFTIYDPFCGSGTVLQEAWLMGFKPQGSDLNTDCVTDTKENLTWLKAEANLEGQPHVFHKDATEIAEDELPEGKFALVSETTLGPALTHPLPDRDIHQIHAELEALYAAFFANLKEIAPKGTIMVFTAPYHRRGNERLFLPYLPDILAEHTTIIPLSDHERPSLFFERKDQLVSREIWKVQIN